MYKRIRDLREDNDKTQKQIADFLGVGTTQYRRWEVGEHKVPAEIVAELAKFYSVSADYILELTEDPTPKQTQIKNNINAINGGNNHIEMK